MTLYFYVCLLMLGIVDLKYKQIGVKDFLILIPPILLHYVKIIIFIGQCMTEAGEFSFWTWWDMISWPWVYLVYVDVCLVNRLVRGT